MIYTPRIQKAIDISITAHMGQTRKGKQVPYIIHPFGVGIILARTGASEDIIIAGVLHDTIEDTEMTFEDIRKEFGEDVARIVNDVTEQDKGLPWEDRKRLAMEHIKDMKQDSLLVKSADLLHNMTDQLNDFEIEGDNMFKRFNASKEMQAERYKNVILELKKAWSQNPLLPDLEANIKTLLQAWKA